MQGKKEKKEKNWSFFLLVKYISRENELNKEIRYGLDKWISSFLLFLGIVFFFNTFVETSFFFIVFFFFIFDLARSSLNVS